MATITRRATLGELLLPLRAGPALRGVCAGAADVRLISNCSREQLGLVRSGERHQDLPDLTAHLLGRCEADGRKLTPTLAGALREHTWPMNVRELFNALSGSAL